LFEEEPGVLALRFGDGEGALEGEAVLLDERRLRAEDGGAGGAVEVEAAGVFACGAAEAGEGDAVEGVFGEAEGGAAFGGAGVVVQGLAGLGEEGEAAAFGVGGAEVRCAVAAEGADGHDDESRCGDEGDGDEASSGAEAGASCAEAGYGVDGGWVLGAAA
jgi:hypothetical protein